VSNHTIAADLTAQARELVSTWPKLTTEQRDHVAAVLQAGSDR
jgi:hypothetical protein